MSLPTLWVDLDGTIADLLTPWIRWANEKYKLGLSYDSITSYDISKCVPERIGGKMFSFLRAVGVYSMVDPYPGARQCIANIVDKYDLIARGMTVVPWSDVRILNEKIAWLSERFPDVHGPHPVRAAHEKAKFVAPGDIVIEDAPDAIIACAVRTDRVVVIDRPYNQGLSDGVRAGDWTEVQEIIEKWLS